MLIKYKKTVHIDKYLNSSRGKNYSNNSVLSYFLIYLSFFFRSFKILFQILPRFKDKKDRFTPKGLLHLKATISYIDPHVSCCHENFFHEEERSFSMYLRAI